MAVSTDVSELKEVLNKILGAVQGNRRGEKTGEGKYFRKDSTSASQTQAYEKLRKEIEYQQDAMKDSRLSFKKLRDEMLKMFRPIHSLSGSFEDMEKELKASVKGTSDEFKKLSKDTYQTYKTLIASGKDFNTALKSMTDGQSRFMKALENAERIAKAPSPIDKSKELQANKEAIKSQIASLAGQMKGKSGKDKEALSDQIKQQQVKLAEVNKSLTTEATLHDAYNKNIVEANRELKESVRQLAKATGGQESLNKINVGNLKAGKTTAGDFAKTREQLKKNTTATLGAAEASHGAYSKFMQNKTESAVKFLTGTAGAIIEDTLPQIAKDFESRQYYGANEAMGTNNVITNTGMSDAEREQLVGKNQSLFRVMGNGDQNATFRNQGGGQSSFLDMQKNIQQNFGMDRKKAAQELVDFGNTMMETGFKPTQDNLKEFSDNLRIAADITGQAPDAVKAFYNSLNQTGQMALLKQGLEAKSDKDQLNAIQRNTAIMFMLNRNVGMSVEEMKTANQDKLKSSHAGLVDSIYQQVGTSMAVSEYNKKNPNNKTTEREQMLGQLTDDQGATLIANGSTTQEELQAAKFKFRDVQAAGEQQRLAAQLASAKAGDIPGMNVAGAGAAFGLEEIAGKFNPFYNQSNSLKAMSEQNLAAGQGTNTAKNAMDSVLAGRFQGQNVGDLTAAGVNKAADAVTEGLNKVAKGLQDFASQLETLKGNALGGPATGLFGFAKDFVAIKAAEKGIGGLWGALKGKIFGAGGAAAEEGAAVAGGEAVAGTGAAAAGATTAATLAASTAAVLGAGAAGYAVGTAANDTWDASKYGSKVNDAIDAVASNGVSAAIMKINAMVSPIYGMQMAAMPNDKISALNAHKAATKFITDTMGTDNLQKWTGDNNDKTIAAQIQNGSLNYKDLKDAGASDDFIEALGDSLTSDTTNDKVVDLLKDISENIKKGNTISETTAKEEDYRQSSRAVIEARINKALKSSADIAKTINAKIASV